MAFFWDRSGNSEKNPGSVVDPHLLVRGISDDVATRSFERGADLLHKASRHFVPMLFGIDKRIIVPGIVSNQSVGIPK